MPSALNRATPILEAPVDGSIEATPAATILPSRWMATACASASGVAEPVEVAAAGKLATTTPVPLAAAPPNAGSGAPLGSRRATANWSEVVTPLVIVENVAETTMLPLASTATPLA